MKKIFLFFTGILFLGLMFSSCSKSSENEPAPAVSIVGKWNQVKTVITTPVGSPQTLPYDQNVAGCDKNYLEFVTNGTLKNVTYSKVNNVCTPAISNATWVLAGNNLQAIIDGQTLSGVVEVLTATELVISTTQIMSGVTVTAVLTLSRA